LSEIRAVTLDLDETMLDRRATFLLFIRSQVARFDRFFHDVDHDEFVNRVVELDRDGVTPKDEVFAGAARDFDLADEAAQTLPRDFLNRFPDECVAFAQLDDVLGQLAESGYRLAIITNGSEEIQQRKIDVMGIGPAFDYIAISETVGVKKPDAEIFHHTLEHLGVAPEEAVHVGDNPRSDIMGGKEAGLRTIWTRSRRWPQGPGTDAVIEEIAQLPEAIERLAV
jgi:putative hydrolase of the HAD superfamily